jgi:LytS/YehU family sensor histidine kinase
MNPHFIFNSLNSVNQYIAENNELEANRYLSSYSGLMRNIMEHSNKDFVSINTELEQLQKYLELEHRRFKDKFDFNIAIDEVIDKDLCMMPNMLLQPHLENAIWHGLRYKETKGMLSLTFTKEGDKIRIVVKDDGIGLKQSQALKTSNQKAHQSRGLTNTRERLQLLNDIYKLQITMDLQEIDKALGTGTIVTIQIPILNKLPV